MGTKLVIVESPAKARKIGSFLGDEYVVEASVGHIRDLPQRAADIPKEYKKFAWAKEGVNIEEEFAPLYVINPDKKSKVAELKELMKDADELILATDEDREGEAIAWHLIEVLRPKIPVRRMVFHEITKDAIQKAAKETRDLDYRLVDAQETRRVLDRLYGYRLSPVLWKKVMPRISAGRVQSVATRLIVERERERMAFISSSWWDLAAACDAGFSARLLSLNGKRVAATNDFDANGGIKDKSAANILLLDEAGARELVQSLQGQSLVVKSLEESPRTERPKPPFTTSTMQQDAGSRLGWGAQLTMRIAQRLYENGYITYMRTDSVTLSSSSITAARSSAQALYGKEFVPATPRVYEGKTKNAQEAHEAIRPAGESFRTPGELAPELSRDEFALYDLIWKRTIASQMSDAKKQQMRVDFDVKTKTGADAIFRANGSVITFAGFLAAYEDIVEDKADVEDTDRRLPAMSVGEKIKVNEYSCEGHETKPPARYTEPTLVKKLEELGIGRPSTFASIMQTIQDRGYVAKRGRALVPTFLAFSVTGLLEQHFTKLIDYEFTASMEEDLDRIANGEEERVAWLTKFFYGTENNPGLADLSADLGAIDAQAINTMKMGEDIEIRVGRFGAYLQQGQGDDRKFANIPEQMAPDELTLPVAIELLAKPSGERKLGVDPGTGLEVIAKSGRFGAYITEVFPEEIVEEGAKKKRKKKDAPKPKTASLLSTMSLDTVDLSDALRLLSLPRSLGSYQDEIITVQNGRYGPYMKHGADSRTLTSEDQLFSIGLEEAIEIYKQPKVRRRGVAKPPLKELGKDPQTEREVIVKDGRFGVYVTDGETNATLRRGDAVELLTLERALELLAGRRAWEIENPGGSKKKGKRAKKSAPTLTEKTVKGAGAKKKAKKAATGVGNAPK
ncbi:DNA topoisomerase I [Candidatus Nanopelagicus hibericus]|uniref:DNA topoisomerase 1 n=1 Tax=Candidatus Nanopelagicus hibericus TaxID=1884915 RepID=A0A249K7Q3_9ACTN|nr:type I DNA topoisomerase [Candidatus Nanopelagicus hibericus]ASY12782.1 DNA topoisomerase I [Candidatus Nanopelagicus hibericus]